MFGRERAREVAWPLRQRCLLTWSPVPGCLEPEPGLSREGTLRPSCGLHYTSELPRPAHTPPQELCKKTSGREGLAKPDLETLLILDFQLLLWNCVCVFASERMSCAKEKHICINNKLKSSSDPCLQRLGNHWEALSWLFGV